MPRARVRAFGLLAAGCIAGMTAAVLSAVGDAPSAIRHGAHAALAAHSEGPGAALVRSLEEASRGRLAVVAADRPADEASITALRCDRVHFAGGRGLCVTRGDDFAAGYGARVLDGELTARREIDVPGVPSRARVSPDGRWGAVTMFVTGHSYAEAGAFSTHTAIIDLARGRVVADLESFTVTRAGRVVDAVDVNFWGVTFARDGDTFFATLATGGRTHLVRGSIRDRTMRTLHHNVECPSLSPDGARIAYKKRVGSGALPWRLTVLELATMRETPLAETAGIDDQAEWLDDERVLYARDGAVHVVPADGQGAPRVWRARADSPAVVRAR